MVWCQFCQDMSLTLKHFLMRRSSWLANPFLLPITFTFPTWLCSLGGNVASSNSMMQKGWRVCQVQLRKFQLFKAQGGRRTTKTTINQWFSYRNYYHWQQLRFSVIKRHFWHRMCAYANFISNRNSATLRFLLAFVSLPIKPDKRPLAPPKSYCRNTEEIQEDGRTSLVRCRSSLSSKWGWFVSGLPVQSLTPAKSCMLPVKAALGGVCLGIHSISSTVSGSWNSLEGRRRRKKKERRNSTYIDPEFTHALEHVLQVIEFVVDPAFVWGVESENARSEDNVSK